MLEVCLCPKGGFLTSPKRRNLLKSVNTEKSGNHVWLRKSPELKIAGDRERAQVSHMLAVIFLIPGHRWVAGGDGGDIIAVLLLAAPRLICSERCVPAMSAAGIGSSWTLKWLFFKPVKLVPVKISLESLNPLPRV